MPDVTEAYDWRGRTLAGSDGEGASPSGEDITGNKLGTLDGVYRRHGSDDVTWGVV